MRSTPGEQAIGEAAGRCARVQADQSCRIYTEPVESAFQFVPAASYKPLLNPVNVRILRYKSSGVSQSLAVHSDLTAKDSGEKPFPVYLRIDPGKKTP
jgi:hypothetical protein